MMPVEYMCEGCGVHVYHYGVDAVPAHGFCTTCAWLSENIHDPNEFDELLHKFSGDAKDDGTE